MLGAESLTYTQWKVYLREGKTVALDLAFILFLFSLMLLFLSRLNLIAFFLSLIAVVATYGMFTDFYAHLFWDGYNADITLKQWFQKLKRLRQHDVSALVIINVAIAFVKPVFLVIYVPLSLFILYYLIKTRFYH
jgi:hypothetical protein